VAGGKILPDKAPFKIYRHFEGGFVFLYARFVLALIALLLVPVHALISKNSNSLKLH
jgi:hypothetical protein